MSKPEVRTLLGWTMPNHVGVMDPDGDVVLICCKDDEHKERLVRPGLNCRKMLTAETYADGVIEFLRDHSHGVSVEYRPEPRQAEVCGAPNGEQSCGEPLGHDGRHMAKVNVGGREYIAPWDDEPIEIGYLSYRMPRDARTWLTALLRDAAIQGWDVDECGRRAKQLLDHWRENDPTPASSVAVSGAIAASPEGEGGEGQNEARDVAEGEPRTWLAGFIYGFAEGTSEASAAVAAEEIIEEFLNVGWLPPSGPLSEWCCPSCGATTRSRLADKVATDLKGKPLPDSETEWGYRAPWGATKPQPNEAEARRWVDMAVPVARVLVRREVGPWTEVDASGDAG